MRACANLSRYPTRALQTTTSGLRERISERRFSAGRSSKRRWICCPARATPLTRLVRPPQKIMRSWPRVASCFFSPSAKPATSATRKTTEAIPHAMPNIVSADLILLCLRSLMLCPKTSARSIRVAFMSPRHDRVAFLQPLEDLGLHPVADPGFDRDLLLARFRARIGDLDRRGPSLVVDDRRLGDDERLRVLLEDDLRVGRHPRLQLFRIVVDDDLDLEGGDVFLLLAEGGDLAHRPFELLVPERLDADARDHPDLDLADVALGDIPLHVHLPHVGDRHDQRPARRRRDDGGDGVPDLHVAAEND